MMGGKLDSVVETEDDSSHSGNETEPRLPVEENESIRAKSNNRIKELFSAI